MKGDKPPPDKFSDLRRRLEERLKAQPHDVGQVSSQDKQRLIHELQVHQIELEIQNEALRQAQEELEAARDKYADLYDNAPVGCFTVGEKDRIVEANLTGANLLGVERGFLLRKPLIGFVARESQDTYYRHRRRVLATGDRERCELKLVKKDGAQFDVQMESVGIRDSDGKVTQRRTFIGDISWRKWTEEALRESEARTRAIVSTAAEGIITIDEQGIIDIFNPAAERIFGYTAAEVIGKNITLLMPAPCREEHDHYIANYLSTGECKVIGIGREVSGRRQDGSIFPLDLAVSEFRDGDQRFFAGLIRDITERKRAEERARQHQAELAHVTRLCTMGEMATTLAHELNQPLGTIANYSQACLRMIRSGVAHPETLVDAIEQTAAEAQRAGEIIRRIRDFVRKECTQTVCGDLNALLRQTVAFVDAEAREKRCTIRLALTEHLPHLLVDRIQIEQVLLNLLRNGIEAMATAKASVRELTISTALHGEGRVRVTVQDTGPGLDNDTTNRVFEPFYTTKAGGIGMGLSISRSIVEAHAGRLWAEPGGPGATFHFTLPVNSG